MSYCSISLRKNSSQLRFLTMFLQVYKYFFCSKTNRRSLLWVEIGICNGRESSNVLNNICLFESCMFSWWYSLNHLKVLEKNSFDSWQYKKVCSTESGLRQKGHSMEWNPFSKSIKRRIPEIFFTSVYSIRSFKSLTVWPINLSFINSVWSEWISLGRKGSIRFAIHFAGFCNQH